MDLSKAMAVPRWEVPERLGYAAKLARAEAAADEPARCSQLTKAGRPCRGFATETGMCVGHSNAAAAKAGDGGDQ